MKRRLETEGRVEESGEVQFGDFDESDEDNDLDFDTVGGGRRKERDTEVYSSASEDSGPKEEVDLPESEGEFTSYKMPPNWKNGENEIPMEPFNLRAEMQEGYFDKDTGSYVRREKETFLEEEDYSTEQIEKARIAHEKRLLIESKANSSNETNQQTILTELISFLVLGETCLEAIQRRGSTTAKRFDARSKRLEAAKMQNDPEYKAKVEANKKEIERITELCSFAMDIGILDIYDLSREEIQRLIQRQQL